MGKEKEKKFNFKSFEKDMLKIQKIMELKGIDTKEEIEKFLNSLIGKDLNKLDENEIIEKDQKMKAKFLVYEAYEKDDLMEAKDLVKQALEIDPDCVDAYNFLGDLEEDDEKALEIYLKAEEAGKKKLGEEFLMENQGNLWGYVDARPYLHAKENIAIVLWNIKKREEAIAKCREILKLNQNDNQGVRYLLCSFLCEMQLFEEAKKLIQEYGNDMGIVWYYNDALIEFAINGDTEKARKKLFDALKRNYFVYYFIMTMNEKFPKEIKEIEDIDSYAIKSPEEALDYIRYNIKSWLITPMAMEWFIGAGSEIMQEHYKEIFDDDELSLDDKSIDDKKKLKINRNDPCPCGSGKKYKKCCGKNNK